MLELSVRDARRLAVRAQLLARPRPTKLADVVAHLSGIQVDQTGYVGPSANIVLWSRLGRRYDPAAFARALERHEIIDLAGFYRPAADVALFRAGMDAWPNLEEKPHLAGAARWVETNDRARRDILDQLREEGPLPATKIDDTCVEPWKSTGWTNGKNVQRMLDFMEGRGEVAVVGREKRARIWDLAERVHPDVKALPLAEAKQERDRRRLANLGIARPAGPGCPVESIDVGDAGTPATVKGVRGPWRVEESLLDQPFRGRAAILSPIDRLIFDRIRMTELFDFDYMLEMYKPAETRIWGYWAMPVLYGDQLVGKIDAESDRKAGVLKVHAIHEDGHWSATQRDAVVAEIHSLAEMLDLEARL